MHFLEAQCRTVFSSELYPASIILCNKSLSASDEHKLSYSDKTSNNWGVNILILKSWYNKIKHYFLFVVDLITLRSLISLLILQLSKIILFSSRQLCYVMSLSWIFPLYFDIKICIQYHNTKHKICALTFIHIPI